MKSLKFNFSLFKFLLKEPVSFEEYLIKNKKIQKKFVQEFQEVLSKNPFSINVNFNQGKHQFKEDFLPQLVWTGYTQVYQKNIPPKEFEERLAHFINKNSFLKFKVDYQKNGYLSNMVITKQYGLSQIILPVDWLYEMLNKHSGFLQNFIKEENVKYEKNTILNDVQSKDTLNSSSVRKNLL